MSSDGLTGPSKGPLDAVHQAYVKEASKRDLDDVRRYKWYGSEWEDMVAIWRVFLKTIPQGASVLEVGCGGGHLAKMIAEERPDVKYSGFDIVGDNIVQRLAKDPGLNIRQGNYWKELSQPTQWDFVISCGVLFSTTDGEFCPLLCELLNASAPKGFLFTALGGSWGIDKAGTDKLKEMVKSTSVGLRELTSGSHGPFDGVKMPHANRAFYVLRDGLKEGVVKPQVPQHLLDYSLDSVAVPAKKEPPAPKGFDVLAAISKFKPVRPGDVPEFNRYYAGFAKNRQFPRFYMSTLWLGTKNEFVWGIVDDCLCVVKRRVMYKNATIYLILPPMHLEGNLEIEKAVMEKFAKGGVGCKLSAEDAGLYGLTGSSSLETDEGNAEFIYRAGDFDDLSGGHNKKWRYQKNELDKLTVEKESKSMSALAAKCAAVDEKWTAVKKMSAKHNAKMISEFGSYAAQGDCWGVVVSRDGEPLLYGLSQRLTAAWAVLLSRQHAFTDKIADASKAQHLLDSGFWSKHAGPDTLLNIGAGVGVKGLEEAKGKMRPVKVMQIFTLKAARTLTLKDYHKSTGSAEQDFDDEVPIGENKESGMSEEKTEKPAVQTPVKIWPTRRMSIEELKPAGYNPRTISEKSMEGLRASLGRFGLADNIAWNKRTGNIVGGHQRYKVLVESGVKEVDVVEVDLDESEEVALNISLNNPHIQGEFEDDGLKGLLDTLQIGVSDTFSGMGLEALHKALQPPERNMHSDALTRAFLFPPFSILSARQGDWAERKRQWISLGIKSEVGRDAVCLPSAKQLEKYGGYGMLSGTSIFDPVLCEISYRWFVAPGGTILDPFAGGSVRGIVAAWVGRKYVGIDLRPEQIEANRKQWEEIGPPKVGALGGEFVNDPEEMTPVQQHGNIWMKRDDLFEVGGVRGGKVRTCLALSKGATGLCTAGSRMSPQVNIVAHIAGKLGVPCRLHTPDGDLSPEVNDAKKCGGEVVQHTPGHNSVIIKRAKDDAIERHWTEIPFGMECEEAVRQTRKQVKNLPPCKRLVVPVGSGMSLSGILWGLKDNNIKVPVVGIRVGADPTERLDKFAPPEWRDMVELIQSKQDYHDPAPESVLDGVQLDPIYESKCLPYIQDGDCLWVVGIRATAMSDLSGKCLTPVWVVGDSLDMDTMKEVPAEVDMVFTCPPYEDLEVYSDDKRDLSNMGHDDFLKIYRKIIAKACARLRNNRFAVIVVGEVRFAEGGYRNFVGETISAFLEAGMTYYNEAIFVTPVGSLPIRITKQFQQSRKMGKTHQNVLVFVKGDPKLATEYCGEVEVAEVLPDQEEAQ